jgi:hypothetical protein
MKLALDPYLIRHIPLLELPAVESDLFMRDTIREYVAAW